MPSATDHVSASIRKSRRWRPVEERFHESYRITPEGCWQWIKAVRSDGYGNTGGKPAHWRGWELFKGPRTTGLCLCHRCNNKLCVNPDHLYEATREQNIKDAARDGLMGRPSYSSGLRRLIREEYANGATQTAIAAKYDMAQATVSRIVAEIKDA